MQMGLAKKKEWVFFARLRISLCRNYAFSRWFSAGKKLTLWFFRVLVGENCQHRERSFSHM